MAGQHSVGADSSFTPGHLDGAAEWIAAWMERTDEFELVAEGLRVVRPEAIALVQRIRNCGGTSRQPCWTETARSMRHVTWLFFEQGLINRAEAEWLELTFDPDQSPNNP